MVRPLPARGRRRTPAVALALLVLGVSGCGVAGSDPGLPVVGGAGGGSGTGMMAAAAAGAVPGTSSMMSGRLTCAAPSSLPGTAVSVTLVDMGMMGTAADPAPLGVPMRLRASTTSVPAGRVTLVAQNLGRRTHELLVLPLAAGRAPGSQTPGSDGKVAETGSLGEVSHACAAGSGDGLTAGTSGWVTLTLAPGRYELVCNEANHYADGMWAELDVT